MRRPMPAQGVDPGHSPEIALLGDDQEPEDKPQQDDGPLSDYFADDEPGVDDFQQVLLQVKNDVNCLMRLAITIRNPAPHEQFKMRMPALVSSFDASHTEHVLHKFPRLQPEYREDHHERLKKGIEVEREDEKEGSRGGVTTEASWMPKDNPEDDEPRPRVWRDDISEQTGTSYAPSCVDDSELRIPRVPPEYVDGPFLCPYCFLPVSIENRYQWKQHVFSDLRPYNCLEPGCAQAETGFVRRKDWFSHVVREHWRTWTCTLGCADRFTTSSLFSEHMSQKHGSATTSLEMDAGSRDDLTKANGKCPLCWEYEIVSSHQYRSHVGHHLEQLALFVLPGAEEIEEQIDEEESGVSQSESQETEDEDQPAEDYEQEQGIPLSGSPTPNVTNDANNMLDAHQSNENSERSSDVRNFKVPQGSNDEFTSTFAEHAMSPSMDEGNSTRPWEHPPKPPAEQDMKSEEEAAKLKYENEARLKLEKKRLDAAGAEIREEAAKREREELLRKVAEEASKKEREELLKKIEEVEAKFRYEHEARLKLEERLNAEEARKKEEASKKEGAERLKKIEETKVAEEVKKASGDDNLKEPIKFKDAVGRKFNFPWHLCATWTVCPDGEIILPVVWEKVIQPGWQINMVMWPMDKHLLEGRPLAGAKRAPRARPSRVETFDGYGSRQQIRRSKGRGNQLTIPAAKPPKKSAEHNVPPHTDQAELKKVSGEETRIKAGEESRGVFATHSKAKEEEDVWETE
ncbi:hypothetical protein LA080_006738 [Diaporthe eres]|nr:hypothetical protein LA080_006738 [Diaporthe eres]